MTKRPTGRPAPQEFEKVLSGAAATVASFDEEQLYAFFSACSASCMSTRRPCHSSC